MGYHTVKGEWHGASPVADRSRWVCGYCSQETQSNVGYFSSGRVSPGPDALIKICSNCNAPTLFVARQQFPASAPGAGPIANCPAELQKLFDEARAALGANAPTAAVLACRKIIHHIAVDRRGIQHGKFANFKEAVEYLHDNRYLPPGGQKWVDYIRDRANDANHQIHLMQADDAEKLLRLARHLLVHIYELPSLAP